MFQKYLERNKIAKSHREIVIYVVFSAFLHTRFLLRKNSKKSKLKEWSKRKQTIYLGPFADNVAQNSYFSIFCISFSEIFGINGQNCGGIEEQIWEPRLTCYSSECAEIKTKLLSSEDHLEEDGQFQKKTERSFGTVVG